jgi:hypothetical protein
VLDVHNNRSRTSCYALLATVQQRSITPLRGDVSDDSWKLKGRSRVWTCPSINCSQESVYKDSAMTFGHATLPPPGEDNLLLYPVPNGVEPEHIWRYRSNGKYWRDINDPLYINFHQQLTEMRLRQGQGAIVPNIVREHQNLLAERLKNAGLAQLATLWDKAYPFTLDQTTFPLADGIVKG